MNGDKCTRGERATIVPRHTAPSWAWDAAVPAVVAGIPIGEFSARFDSPMAQQVAETAYQEAAAIYPVRIYLAGPIRYHPDLAAAGAWRREAAALIAARGGVWMFRLKARAARSPWRTLSGRRS
mgnify:CR=1 FL=1